MTTQRASRRNDTGFTVTIPSGQSLSSAVDLTDWILTRIDMPAAWTSAALTFQVSSDGVNFRDYYDSDGNELSIGSTVATASRAIVPGFGGSLYWWAGVRYLKLRSGTSAAPVNQAADRTIGLYAGLST